MLYIKPSDHDRTRPVVHPSQRQHHVTPVSQPLYVVCALSNPQRYYSRHKNYYGFEKHMADSGAILYTVELALRDRHFELTTSDNPQHIQLRAEAELWHKENLINVGVSRLPADWHYAAYCDADFLFTRPDWVVETIHMLQHYRWVQLFSSYADMLPGHVSSRSMPSFASIKNNLDAKEWASPYYGAGRILGMGAPGGAWAWRREAFDDVGGLLDTCILGSADWHMAFALADKVDRHTELSNCTKSYVESLHEWADRATSNRGSVGCVENHAIHYWHGSKDQRAYSSRWKILKKHGFNPRTDIKKDWQGVLGWTGHKPGLEEDVRQYFKARNEDS